MWKIERRNNKKEEEERERGNGEEIKRREAEDKSVRVCFLVWTMKIMTWSCSVKVKLT